MAGAATTLAIGALLVLLISLDTTILLAATVLVPPLFYLLHLTILLSEVRLLFPGLKMDTQAYDLLMVMRNGEVAVETKTSLIATLKSDIKNRHVPENAVPYMFDIVRNAIASPHPSLSGAGFTTLGYLLKRLFLQDQLHVIGAQGPKTFPILMDRLGDHKEKLRDQAAQAFTDFWMASTAEVEHHVLDGGLTSKSTKTKERSLVWLSFMSKEKGLLFRNYVPKVVDCLEDADGGVRETAKATVIELFQNSPDRAKADLKKQLQVRNIRKSIANAILNSLNLTNAAETEFKSSLSKHHISSQDSAISMTFEDAQRPPSVASFRSSAKIDLSKKDINSSTATHPKKESVNSHTHAKTNSRDKVSTSFAQPKDDPQRKDALLSGTVLEDLQAHTSSLDENGEKIDPLYVNTTREFDEMMRDMLPHFEGKESEQNWVAREKSILKLRKLTSGNAPHDFNNVYIAGIKTMLEGILKTVNSLRTTVSANGCYLLQDIARTAGPGIDAMVEILLQALIKLCGGTKKIAAQNGNVTVDAIVGNVSYNIRLLHHLWNACQDKNVQPRSFVTGWLKTLINKHGRQKSSIEHGGGLELIEKCIKKGLADANPGVREGMRGTYWTFAKVWPDSAEVIMSTLDAKSKGLLEKDPGNPNRAVTSTASSRPAPTMSQSTTAVPARPSIRDLIAAQKRATAQDLPSRPESAQSIFSEPKLSVTPKVSRPPLTAAATTRAIPPTSIAPSHNAGSLSSAPMRPPVRPVRRPELMRPATADPYASRRLLHQESNSKTTSLTETPMKTRPKTAAPAVASAAKQTSPVKQLKKPSPSTSPMKVKTKKPDVPHPKESETGQMATPAFKTLALRPFDVAESLPSPTKANEDFTMLMPTIKTISDIDLPSNKRDSGLSNDRIMKGSTIFSGSIGRHSPTNSTDLPNAETLKVYEDPVPMTTGEVQSQSTTLADEYETLRASTKVKALEELPVNEPATLPFRPFPGFPSEFEAVSPLNGVGNHQGENSHRRWNKVEAAEKRKSISPRLKDPDQARNMLDNGISKIQARNLDVHGYRKLQGLIKEHDNIFKDEAKYDDLLLALLDSLETPNEEKRTALGRSLDLKTQCLVTIRLMYAHNKMYFSAYYPRAMTAVITARKYYDAKDHIVSGLEETSEDIAAACDPGDVIDAILDVLETEERNQAGYRTISMGIYILSGLLHRLNTRNMTMPKPELQRLGKLAFRSIRDTHPDTRRAVIDYCLELRDLVEPEDEFWSMINDSVEDYRALLTYYIVRRPTRV